MQTVSSSFLKALSAKNAIFQTSWRCLSSQKIAENLFMYSEKPEKFAVDQKTFRLTSAPTGRKLALISSWLDSKPRSVEKFCSIYTENGFDVLVVRNLGKNVVVPKGSQKLAGNVVKFLENNESYKKILVHGFSAGGYVWGECLVHLRKSPKNEEVSSRIKGQIWDSTLSANEVAVGTGETFFTNKLVQVSVQKFMDLLLWIFHDFTLKHHFHSQKYFHHKPMLAPALIFASKIDKLGTEKHNREIYENFKKQNIDTTLKIFDDSPHILHYRKYPEEYSKLLMNHLKKCKLIE